MGEPIKVTGMVLSAMPVGETDKRLVILTKERGKVSGFARGAKRTNSPMLAASQPFVFGEFQLMEGRGTYSIVGAKVQEYFEDVSMDIEAACYGCYFLELADYYGRENDDDIEMLKLLYQTIRALCRKTIPFPLIRCVYELRIMAVNGECPVLFECAVCGSKQLDVFSALKRGMLCEKCRSQGGMNAIPMMPATVYTMQYIVTSAIEKLYTFKVTDEVMGELQRATERYCHMYIDKKFKSLEVLSTFLAV